VSFGETRFKAFISYSHRDKGAAAWLHRALETYRVPKHLVGRETVAGLVKARVGKVFRDRDELAVSADLSGEINEALKATQFLVVLCSPASAKSKWVNQEIINFSCLKGDGCIICVIVDGEPYASNKPGQEDQECFAPALRFQVNNDGTVSDRPAEPIAADMRSHADGKQLAKYKVIAGLLGVGLDELVQRENQRHQYRLALVTAASLASMVVLSGLTWNAISAQRLAEERRGESEGLVEFMIEDLRHPLEEVGRLDAFEKVIEKTLQYFEAQDLADAPDETLGRWARALHFAANTRFQLGDDVAALEAANAAHAVTAELVERGPDSLQRLSEHGQSKFWLGQIEYAAENFHKASVSMRSYFSIAKALANEHPQNVTYVANAGRAAYSYGAVLTKTRNLERAIEHFLLADAYWGQLDKLIPDNEDVQLDRLYTNQWLADAYELSGDANESLKLGAKNVDGFRGFHERYPDDKDLEYSLVRELHRLSALELSAGSANVGIGHLNEARVRIEKLVSFDSKNENWRSEASAIEKLILDTAKK